MRLAPAHLQRPFCTSPLLQSGQDMVNITSASTQQSRFRGSCITSLSVAQIESTNASAPLAYPFQAFQARCRQALKRNSQLLTAICHVLCM